MVNIRCEIPADLPAIREVNEKAFGSGIEAMKKDGHAAVAVLGHPEYYPRFGFAPSVRYGIRSEYDVPNEVFMVKELEAGALAGRRGVVKYHSAFGNAT